MNAWMAEAEQLARRRAPRLSHERAAAIAEDLYKARHEEWTAAQAVAWFFAFMPAGWNASVERLAA
jgi:hypothetical protein